VPGFCLFVGIGLPLCAAAASLGGSVEWQNVFLSAWIALAGFYLAASLVSAFSIARLEGWKFLPLLPIVFATYQLSYAMGFLLALLYRPTAGSRPNPQRSVATTITR
jgi:hypothetical protein